MRLEGVDGLLVLEFAEGIAGPECGMILADLGARVIKIEPPSGDWSRHLGPPLVNGESPVYLTHNRNKESLVLNLKDDEDRAAAIKLVRRADVLIAGYRPGALEKLGLGPEDAVRLNPSLVYCAISGYGNRGPHRLRPGSDTIIQGYSGIMSLTGEADRPPSRVGTPIADTASGVYAALGVLAMLLRRATTGKGGTCDTSLLESMIHLQSPSLADFFAGANLHRMGARSGLSAVPAEAFATADSYVSVSCHAPRQWQRFCTALGRLDWITDPTFATNQDRVRNYAEVRQAIQDVLSTKTTTEWMRLFEANGVNAGPIHSYDDLMSDAHVQALEIFETHEGPRVGPISQIRLPVTFHDGLGMPRRDEPPTLGGQSDQIRQEFGLRKKGE